VADRSPLPSLPRPIAGAGGQLREMTTPAIREIVGSNHASRESRREKGPEGNRCHPLIPLPAPGGSPTSGGAVPEMHRSAGARHMWLGTPTDYNTNALLYE
jgi:hypothetical protein